MYTNENPFRQFRAEQMGPDLWKLYVPGPFKNILTPRPLVLEGGRGSGKTMFFLCNSWKERLKSLKHQSGGVLELINTPPSIGLYYKVDTAFVTAMQGQERSDWAGIFNTYLGIRLSMDLFCFIKQAIDEGVVKSEEVHETIKLLNIFVKSNREIVDVDEGIKECEAVLDGIEKTLNCSIEVLNYHPTVAGRIINKIIESLTIVPCFSNTVFRIYIDEYETLLEYQQQLINLLIKHSTDKIIYNIGVRPKGMLSPKVYGSEEIIQPPHDYYLFRPEMVLIPDGGASKSGYYDMLREVCRLRFKQFNSAHASSIPEDIEYYLGCYDIDQEIRLITENKKTVPFEERFINLIYKLEPNPEKSERYIQELIKNTEPLNARLHFSLLLRSEQYRPSLEKLVYEYEQYKNGQSCTYKTWLHNMKFGLVFLLAREYRVQKQYYGFDVFALLSSGVIRYFLELCEQSFDYAMLNGFNWSTPKPISPEDQSKAARYVSKYKTNDVLSYDPYGKTLKIFVENIGNVFKELHRNADATLGEPEINHFCTNDLELHDDTKKVLNSAVRWAVLQERESTKEKISALPTETIDYHLNHIYCPHFEISYRKKRKLVLTPEQIEGFLSGNNSEAKKIARELLAKKMNLDEYSAQESKANTIQLSIFGEKSCD